jgi:hypothetical protein
VLGNSSLWRKGGTSVLAESVEKISKRTNVFYYWKESTKKIYIGRRVTEVTVVNPKKGDVVEDLVST